MEEPKQSLVEVGPVRLSVEDWGGDGPPIVLVHPTGFLGAVWRPVVGELRKRGLGARIITYDQRGHGRSSKPDDGYEWLDFAHDLEGLLDELGLEDVLGVGHSAGATAIVCVAAGERNRFRRLVLIDPVLFDPDGVVVALGDGPNPMVERTRNRRMVWSSREELLGSLSTREPFDTWTPEALGAYVEHGTFDRPDGEVELWCPARIEARIYESGRRMDAFSYLRRVSVPALVLRGENSFSFPEERARRAMEALPSGRLVTLAGTTHFVPMERPAEVAELIACEYRG